MQRWSQDKSFKGEGRRQVWRGHSVSEINCDCIHISNRSKHESRKLNYIKQKILKLKRLSPTKLVSAHQGLDLIKQNLLSWWWATCETCKSGSFITQVDTRLHRGILGICVIGGQQDIYLTVPASVQCLELTMSVVMGINNADPWPDKNSLSPWLPSQHRALCSTHISHYMPHNRLAGFCCNEMYIAHVNTMTDIPSVAIEWIYIPTF